MRVVNRRCATCGAASHLNDLVGWVFDQDTRQRWCSRCAHVRLPGSDMIERVARALLECIGVSWETVRPEMRALYVTQARAAVTAMREPTAAMIEAQTSVEMLSGYEGDPTADYPDAPNIWRAMIDAALDTPSSPATT